jgi:hypothetical protein
VLCSYPCTTNNSLKGPDRFRRGWPGVVRACVVVVGRSRGPRPIVVLHQGGHSSRLTHLAQATLTDHTKVHAALVWPPESLVKEISKPNVNMSVCTPQFKFLLFVRPIKVHKYVHRDDLRLSSLGIEYLQMRKAY